MMDKINILVVKEKSSKKSYRFSNLLFHCN